MWPLRVHLLAKRYLKKIQSPWNTTLKDASLIANISLHVISFTPICFQMESIKFLNNKIKRVSLSNETTASHQREELSTTSYQLKTRQLLQALEMEEEDLRR